MSEDKKQNKFKVLLIEARQPPYCIALVSGCHSSQIKIKMRSYKNELEAIANDLLTQNAEAKGNENKPNYSNRDFMNATIIFQTALMDKMYDNQDYDGMSMDDKMKMAESCGLALRKLIHTYTGLDTHKIEEFL